MPCINDEILVAFVEGGLPADENTAVHEHLATCADCRMVVMETTRWMAEQRPGQTAAKESHPLPPPTSLPDQAPLPEGTKVHRYELRKPLGMGAWGIVYEGYDPELRRRVAVKLLRPIRVSADGEADQRLLREAQAMAQLSHPNVVNVHDVGTYAGMVFVVMELVEGETLATWQHRSPRHWRDIIGIFVEAARGLAAAHAASLIHRDFKPENVLVGADDRARVTDFGLARSVSDRVLEGPIGLGATAGAATAVAGTPFFMAPEQLLGKKADARSDQFSFCVSLYQALYGEHPFGAPGLNRTLLDMADDVIANRRKPVPPNNIPPWVAEALARGLEADPQKRYPSMNALIDTLTGPTKTSTKRRWIWASMGGGLALVAVVLAAGRSRPGGSARALISENGRCGDGSLDSTEECDDGNTNDQDGCTATCRWARCGDKIIRAGVETCDDGNTDDEDGCTSICVRCTEGDARLAWKGNGHCYTRHDTPLPVPSARKVCQESGAELVVYGPQEMLAVRRNLLRPSDGATWVGLEHLGRREFAWITGESRQFTWWAQGEPKAGSDECVAERDWSLLSDAAAQPTNASQWAVADCKQSLRFACENAGWVLRSTNNHAYKVIWNRVGWATARDTCVTMGGHLVTIKDAEEGAFITSNAFVDFWIGATDQGQEGRFLWTTGEEFSYQNFSPNEPDDPDGKADCLLLGSDRLWHDRSCGQGNGFVCEID